MRPIWLTSVSENQTLPSGPRMMPSGPAFGVGSGKFGDLALERDAADLVRGLLAEPECAVGADGDADRRRLGIGSANSVKPPLPDRAGRSCRCRFRRTTGSGRALRCRYRGRCPALGMRCSRMVTFGAAIGSFRPPTIRALGAARQRLLYRNARHLLGVGSMFAGGSEQIARILQSALDGKDAARTSTQSRRPSSRTTPPAKRHSARPSAAQADRLRTPVLFAIAEKNGFRGRYVALLEATCTTPREAPLT